MGLAQNSDNFQFNVGPYLFDIPCSRKMPGSFPPMEPTRKHHSGNRIDGSYYTLQTQHVSYMIMDVDLIAYNASQNLLSVKCIAELFKALQKYSILYQSYHIQCIAEMTVHTRNHMVFTTCCTACSM